MAVNKSARQIDAFTETDAFLAVDGNISTCTRTSERAQPWWEVNFGQRFIVQGLVIDAPQDNLGAYLPFQLLVSELDASISDF